MTACPPHPTLSPCSGGEGGVRGAYSMLSQLAEGSADTKARYSTPRRSGMRMTDFIAREAIIPELTATNKETVIREMIASLGSAGYIKGGDTEDIVKAVLKRELLGSTGI